MTTDNYMLAAAKELAASFVTATRADGSGFIRCADTAPEWVREAARDAHADMLPDDTRYSMISEVADAIAEAVERAEDLDDARHERIDAMVPVYNRERVEWLASHLSRACYVDEARREFGTEGQDLFDQLAAGIYAEYSEIWNALVDAITSRADELETEADEA